MHSLPWREWVNARGQVAPTGLKKLWCWFVRCWSSLQGSISLMLVCNRLAAITGQKLIVVMGESAFYGARMFCNRYDNVDFPYDSIFCSSLLKGRFPLTWTITIMYYSPVGATCLYNKLPTQQKPRRGDLFPLHSNFCFYLYAFSADKR
jgi:hypothetical protein